MSSPRGDARRAVADWITGGVVTYLDVCHLAHPLRLNWNAYGSEPFKAQAVVYIADEGELRMALGGEHSGWKRVDYLVVLEVYFRSTSTDTVASLEAFDAVVDGIKVRLRADRRLGENEQVVWQAGEGSYGIQCDFMVPDENVVGGEPLEYYAAMRFEITQWVQA